MYLLTAEEMRQTDAMTINEFGLPGRILMENAGRGASRIILETWPDICNREVSIVAGPGNNGGDGFVIARCLSQAGTRVKVYLLADRGRVQGDALANLELLSRMGLAVIPLPDENTFIRHISDMDQNSLWVDAILGTGLTSNIKGYFKSVINHINTHSSPVFAVDIPSGLNSETGNPCGVCIQANATATFGFAKIGQVLMPGAAYTGSLHVIDIGIPPEIAQRVTPWHHLTRAGEIRTAIKPRPLQAHKGTTGHLLVAAGSTGKSGAAVMTAMSAMRCGAGLVTLVIPESINMAVESLACEAMTRPMPDKGMGVLDDSAANDILALLADKRCLALGPGIGSSEGTEKLVRHLVQKSPVPVVIDADGLNCIAGETGILKNKKTDVILTPHPGEMSRLTGLTITDVLKDVVGCARRFAQVHDVYVVLKGARTVIAFPNGSVYVNPTGNPGMASGGMGDVLTGMIAGFITQNYDIGSSLRIAVYLHGASADTLNRERARFGYLATDVMNNVPETIRSMMDDTLPDECDIFFPIL